MGGSAEFNRLRGEIGRVGSIIAGVADFKQNSDIARIRRLLPELLSHRAYRQIIWQNEKPKSAKQLITGGIPCFCSFETEVEWAAHSLMAQAPTLRQFVAARARCERLYLLGDTATLLEELDAIEAEFGLSLWLIESRINALQLQSGLAAQKEYASGLSSDQSIYVLARYLISWLSFRSEENISAGEFKRLVDDAIPEDIQIYGFVQAALGTARALDASIAALALAHSDRLPPIDRYRFFLIIVQAALAYDTALSLEAVTPTICLLASRVDDPQLHRLVSVLGYEPEGHAPSLANILDDYAEGNYAAVVSAAEKRIVGHACVDALLIAVRAEALCGRRYAIPNLCADTPLAKICADLVDMSFSGEGAAEAETRLAKTQVSNSSAGWSSSIDLFLQRQRHDERIRSPLADQGFAALRTPTNNPYLAYSMTPARAEAYLEKSFPKDSQGAAWRSVKVLTDQNETQAISWGTNERNKRLDAIRHLRRDELGNAVKVLEHGNEIADGSVDWLEAQLLAAEALLRAGDLERACDVCIRLILKSAYLARRLPLRALVDALATWDDKADRSDRVLGTLSVILLLEMYGRHVATDREDLKSDAFIDYLAREGKNRPSEIEFDPADPNPERILYFYRFLCVPDTLDQCYALTSTREVEDERARIIVRCGELYAVTDRAAPTELQDELQQIRTQQVIRDTSFELDQSKIFVDIEGIQASLGSTMRENWHRYRLLGMQQLAGSIDEIVKTLEAALGKKLAVVSAAPPVTERNILFRRMFREISDQFSTSKLFGLDANLSTNVRHGYILRELRGPFVAAYLVTNLINEESGYRPNRHWLDRFDVRSDDNIEEFSRCLDAFSTAVDTEIERLTRKKIKIFSEANPDGLFAFAVDPIAFQIFQSHVDEVETYDEFLRIAFELLWSVTQIGLNKVQTCLRSESQAIFNAALSELSEEADRHLSRENASAIKQAISLARPEVAAAIERVANWFTLSTSREYQDYPLRIAFDVGVATVASYFSEVNFCVDLDGADEIIMAGWTLPWIPRLFMLLIENAGIHSGISEGDLVITGSASLKEGVLEISISNQLAASVDRLELGATVARLNADFGSKTAEDFVQTERGSGYPKLWKILRHDLRRDYAIEVSVTSDGYQVDIMMNKEGIVR